MMEQSILRNFRFDPVGECLHAYSSFLEDVVRLYGIMSLLCPVFVALFPEISWKGTTVV